MWAMGAVRTSATNEVRSERGETALCDPPPWSRRSPLRRSPSGRESPLWPDELMAKTKAPGTEDPLVVRIRERRERLRREFGNFGTLGTLRELRDEER